MHDYEYINKPEELLTPEVVQLLGTLRECKGHQDLFVEAKADVLTQLLEVAKIQSTGASNRIEGIYTSDELDRLHWYNMEGNYNPADYDTDMARIVCKEYCR